MKIHLLDGTWELFRAHFGAPPAKASDGTEVGAVRGLLRSLHALVAQNGASHLACAFDAVIESFRNDIFPGYKSSEGVPEELLAQFRLAEEACESLGIVCWPMWEVEADDAIATAAARLMELPEVRQVVISTPDKDLAQCVSGERVVQWDRQRGTYFDEAGVREKFGVAPRSIPDFLGLVGDTADGIPGLPGWGPKSASTLLATYGSIEEIPSDPASWIPRVRGAPRLSATLEERRDDAILYKRLATLRSDVDLEVDPDALRWRGARREPLIALCEKIGERNLVGRVTLWRED